MKTSTKLLSMFSAFCASLLIGLTTNAQSITVSGGLTANQMAQALVGSNVTVSNATLTGGATASGSFNQGVSTFPLSDGIILTSGSINNALGPNNSTGASASNNTPGDTDLNALVPGFNTFDACVLEFDVTSNCNTLTFDYIFASEEYVEYGCSNFNDAFGFLITGPGFAPNTNIALVPGTTTPVSINNVINSPATNCVSNPSFYVDNAAGVSVQYDGFTVVMTATATIQPCQTYHVKIVVGDAGDSALDSAIFLKGGGINCSSSNLLATANITSIECGALGAIDLSLGNGTGPFTYAWTGPNGFTASTEDLTSLEAGDYTVDIVGSDCLSSGEFTYTVTETTDVTAPVFTTCPSDLIIEAASNGCTFAVNIPEPTVTDNCTSSPVVTSSYTPGDEFSVGTTPVTYTATDAAGNVSTCTFNVIINAQPLVVTLTPSVYVGGVNIKCWGQNSGWADCGATGGCLPYTYDWNINGTPMPNGPSTVTGLFAGAVSVTVTDANGTSVTESVNLIQNPAVQSVPTWAPIQCYGGSTTVTVNAQAGTAPYSGTSSYTVSAGTYQYTVADANGCRDREMITITQPEILDVTATPTPILCFGDSSIVTVAATGGTMPYTGVGPVSEVAGTYTYVVVDANGCTENTQLSINQPSALTASISATPILCNGGTSEVTVSVASGTEPYTGTGTSTEFAGTYTYVVYDYNLCEDSISITITEPAALVVTASSTAISCAGDSSDITIAATGGTAPYSGTGTYTEAGGTYDYTVTDANGCTTTISTTVSEPTELAMNISSTGIACFGEMADIIVTATGGTAPYTGVGTFTVGSGTYTYTVIDANGCSVSDTISIVEPAEMTAYVSCPGILCHGGTADIGVTAFGGTAPYTGTGILTVSAGTDTYIVTDANGCTASVTHTVTEPAALFVTITSTGVDCNGGSTDVIVNGTGGTAPYTGTGTFSLVAGTYTYSITDANGCTADTTITVSEPATLVVSATADSILCNGDSSDITITATGGTAPYTGTGVYSVTAGTYTYIVTDANGCTATTSITLTEPTLMTAYVSCPGILCHGGTADIGVTAFGGTAPYTGTGIFTVSAGTDTYIVTDANGCTASVTHTVTEPAALIISITSTGIDCNGGTSDITVTGTGGTAPYTGTGSFNVAAGTYTYSIIDANGCSADTTITVTEPTELAASISATSILCNGETADITVTATGGTAPYTGTGVYTVSGGTYSYTVTDANGCSVVVTTTVVEPTELIASISATSILCNGGTADITVTATGGTAPYTGTGVYTVSGGTYSYTVTDANGCSIVVTTTVAEPAALIISIASAGIDCNGGTSDITVTGTGGTAPYTGVGTYSVVAGAYTYSITDANGCTADTTITVSEPATLVASAIADSILCNGDSSDITITATGGTAPYTGVGTFNVTAGSYTYTVTDANGCTATTSITLTEPTLMTAYVSCPGILCHGGTADIGVTAFGGTAPYTGTGIFTVSAGTDTYIVTDANGCTASVTHTVTEPAALFVTIASAGIDCNGGTTDVTVNGTGGTAPYTGTGTINVSAGTYTYSITDANGCTADTTITVIEPATLVASATAASILCNGGSADVVVTATGGTAPYTGVGTFNLAAGTYTYTVTDANGCTATTSITLTEPTLMSGFTSCPIIDCNGGTANIAVFAFGGTAPYTGIGVFNVGAGTYTYTITDANGCSVDVTHTVTEPAPINVTISSTGIDCFGGTANITVTATGGTAPYTGTGSYSVAAGTYTYTVTDANGCSTTESITVAEPAELVASISATSILCNGGTADITVTATGGTAPYIGTGVYSVTEGTYSYTVTDANGCSVVVTTTVVEPTQMSASISATTILCNGGTADITVTATGGTAPYTGVGTFTVTGGTYTYTVIDANGCSVNVSTTVTEPTELVVSISATSILCNGGTADITVTATGGTAPYTGTGVYSVTEGTYSYTVTDANGCSVVVTTTVVEPTELVASVSATSILCNGGTADITVSATGGAAPYTGTGVYSVSGGTYSYTVTDANGCSVVVTTTVVEPTELTATATVGTFDCSTLTSDVTIAAAGGTAPYTGTGTVSQSSGSTTYIVTDANGCTVTVSATVEVESFVDLTCPGDQTYDCNYSQSCGSQNTGSVVSWDEPTASSFSTCDNGCGPNTQIAGFIYMGEFDGSRYYCSNTSNYSWQAANTASINAGGHLATIQSAAENEFVRTQIMANEAWIGLTDQNVEGTFEWANGESVGYTNWTTYEPNNNGPTPNSCTPCGEADFTVVRASHGGWYDRYECNTHEFVMEIPCGNPITITQTAGPANGTFIQGGTSQVVTYVAVDDVTGASATCNFTVTVDECTPVYCESEGACTAYEWIDQVSLGSINNLSGNDGGYADYTSMTTTAAHGDVVNLQLTPGFSGSAYTETWRVWVDWNYDGDFYDQGELVYQGYGSSAVNGSFTVPSFAVLNKDLRVRVSMRWNCYAGPCSYFQYGEVEDYTISIQDFTVPDGMQTVMSQENSSLKEDGAKSRDNVKSYDDVIEDGSTEGVGLEMGDIYPNPILASKGVFNLDIRTGSKAEVTIRIIDLAGKVMLTDFVLLETGANKHTMDVTGFARGSYIIEVVSGGLKESTQLIVQ